MFNEYAIKAPRVGLIALESDTYEDKNPVLKQLLLMTAGYEPDTIRDFARLKQEWALRTAKHSDTIVNKDEYLTKLEKEFNLIIKGVLSVQSWDAPDTVKEELERLYDADNSQDNWKKELSIYSKTIDDLETTIVTENPQDLIKKLVEYATKARKDGILSLLENILQEKNKYLRGLMQKVLFGQGYYYDPLQIELELELIKAKGYTDDTFLFNYERELTSISRALAMISSGDTPRTIERLLLQIYPDMPLSSMFD